MRNNFRNDKGISEFRCIVWIDEIISDIRLFLKNNAQQANLCSKFGRSTELMC